MSEQPEKKGTRLEHAIAQAREDIKVIDIKCTGLQREAEKLRAEQVEIAEMLSKLEGVAPVEEPAPL